MGKTSAVRPDVPLQISNLDKVFWPDDGYTKLDLIRFYVEVFEQPSGNDMPWVLRDLRF